MPPPSRLAIATGAVNRLLKEDASYRKELVDQIAKVELLEEKIKSGQEDEDGNAEYVLKQQKRAIEETKAIFEPLKQRIEIAYSRLEEQVLLEEKSGDAASAELENAKAALQNVKAACL